MRLFLAIDLPAKVKEQIEEQIIGLKKDYANFNWVAKFNYHITLLFFGEIAILEKIRDLKTKIEEAIFDVHSFRLYSFGADVFLNNKITLYINFRREKTIEALVAKLKNTLHFEDKKKFVPHLSIARNKIPSKQQYLHLKKKLENLSIEIDFPVKKIHLFQSILEEQKPVYKKISSFSLLES